MPRTEEQTRSLFDEWAKSYDADLLKEGGPLLGYAQSVGAIDDALPIARDSQVLDIGIGSGALARRLADRGAQITGIDISDKMLELCRERNPSFELHIGTFNNIPLPDEKFDCVVSGFALHETLPPKRSDACAEMARVLKSSGHLCLLDIMFASELAMQEARQLIAEKWDDDEDYAIVGDLDTLLRQNGFTAVIWCQTAPFHWMVTARKV
jgi:putative AdoMet-dependent methyltransferase